MHANHFRRLALAQGLLPPDQPPSPAPERPSDIDASDPVAAPSVERASDSVH